MVCWRQLDLPLLIQTSRTRLSEYQKLLIPLALLFPLAAQAQSISPAQIEQFKQLPKAQQEALARQYGVDINSITGSQRTNQRPEQVNVVEPVTSITDDERDRARAEKEEEDEQAEKTAV